MAKKSFKELSKIAKKAVKTRKVREAKKRKIKAGLRAKRKRLITGGHTKKIQDLKREVFTVYSKKLSKSNKACCNCCGENTSLDFLCMDHILFNVQSDREKKDWYRWVVPDFAYFLQIVIVHYDL